MILEYHRPETVDEALDLLRRVSPRTVPMGGGSTFQQLFHDEGVAVVDLQKLPLAEISVQADRMEVGGMARLQDLIDDERVPDALRQGLRLEATVNQRRMGTVGGMIVACDGRSAGVTVLLAMDATLTWLPGEISTPIGSYLPLKHDRPPGLLLARLSLPIGVKVAFMATNRTPVDRPLVCAAVCKWPSGRTRVTLGGFGDSPMLAMDGPESTGGELAARAAYKLASDAWAGADFRSDVAGQLTRRLVASLGR